MDDENRDIEVETAGANEPEPTTQEDSHEQPDIEANVKLQERMAADDDAPWYSESTGAYVTTDGDVIVDAQGKPYRKGEYERLLRDYPHLNKSGNTAKPENGNDGKQTEEQKASTGDSFEKMLFEGGEITPEKLVEISKTVGGYNYTDELVPKIQTGEKSDEEPEKTLPPTKAVEEEKGFLEDSLVKPIAAIRDALVKAGADEEWIRQNIDTILERQRTLVEKKYQEDYKKALQDELQRPMKSKLDELNAKELETKSGANIEKFARMYYPQHGKEAFFALINGHNETGPDGKQKFVRGPAVEVIDLIISVANEGKTFGNEQERIKAYADTFRKLTADTAKARALINIAHNYYLGKNIQKAAKIGYEQGKKSASEEQQRRLKTVKTPPASYQAGVDEDTERMPEMLRYALGMK